MDPTTAPEDIEVRSIVNRVLGERWQGAGFDHADVVPEDDVYGEPALTVTAWLKAGSPVLPVGLYSDALLSLREAIRSAGEQRYAYIRLRRPDETDEEDAAPDQP